MQSGSLSLLVAWLGFGCAARATPVIDAPVIAETIDERDSVGKPELLIVAGDIPGSRRDSMLHAAREFYRFWATGDKQPLSRAISPLFVDRTLPKGRPQGASGPATAGKAFHAAVPDLAVTVVQQLLVADRVVSHLRFTGHFTGTFGDLRGGGQQVDFIATDIVRVQNGFITDNWHIEDNLTFLQQIGLIVGVHTASMPSSAPPGNAPSP